MRKKKEILIFGAVNDSYGLEGYLVLGGSDNEKTPYSANFLQDVTFPNPVRMLSKNLDPPIKKKGHALSESSMNAYEKFGDSWNSRSEIY